MDAEALLNCEGYARLLAMRDDTLARVVEGAAVVRERIEAMAAGSRHQRRLASREFRRLERMERKVRARMDETLQRLANGFDPATGTISAVQEEAAAELAGIFS